MTRRPSQELPKKVGGWDGRKGGKNAGKVFTPKKSTDTFVHKLSKRKSSESASQVKDEKIQKSDNRGDEPKAGKDEK